MKREENTQKTKDKWKSNILIWLDFYIMNKNTHKIKNTNLRLIFCCPLKYSKEMKPEENNQNT